MKTRSTLALFVSVLIITSGCNQSQSKKEASVKTDEDTIRETLKNFYTDYITTIAVSPDNFQARLDSLTRLYSTPKLLMKIDKDTEEGMDYDPYINAQDADSAWLKTLSIRKNTQTPNGYAVSYLDNYSRKKVTINLLVIKQANQFRIDSIW